MSTKNLGHSEVHNFYCHPIGQKDVGEWVDSGFFVILQEVNPSILSIDKTYYVVLLADGRIMWSFLHLIRKL